MGLEASPFVLTLEGPDGRIDEPRRHGGHLAGRIPAILGELTQAGQHPPELPRQGPADMTSPTPLIRIGCRQRAQLVEITQQIHRRPQMAGPHAHGLVLLRARQLGHRPEDTDALDQRVALRARARVLLTPPYQLREGIDHGPRPHVPNPPRVGEVGLEPNLQRLEIARRYPRAAGPGMNRTQRHKLTDGRPALVDRDRADAEQISPLRHRGRFLELADEGAEPLERDEVGRGRMRLELTPADQLIEGLAHRRPWLDKGLALRHARPP